MATATFSITLSSPAMEPAFTKFSLIDGSAGSVLNGMPDKNIADYKSVKGYITFDIGQATATVDVDVSDKVASDFAKTFYLQLYDAHNCEIDTTPVKCTIVYNGNTTEQVENTYFYSLDSTPISVDDLPEYFSYVSFSSPENSRWSDTNNIMNRTADWITEGYYQYYSRQGLKYQRLCNAYEVIQDQPFGDPVPFNTVMQRKAISWANSNGIKTITSNHNDSQWCLDGCVASVGDGILSEKAFSHMIQTQAKVFQDLPGYVGIQLNGEPASTALHNMTNETWTTFALSGLSAVREVNDQIYVLVDGAGGAVPVHFPESNVPLQSMSDPSNRAFITADIYMDTYAGGGLAYMDDIMKEGDGYFYDVPIDGTTGQRRVNWILPWTKTYGHKLLIGETGGGQQDSHESLSSDKWSEVVDGMANECYNNNVPMGIWCSGPDFNTCYQDFAGLYVNRYPLTLDPYGSSLRYGIYEGSASQCLGEFSRYFGPDISLSWIVDISFNVSTSNATTINFSFPYKSSYNIPITITDGSDSGIFSNGNSVTLLANEDTQTTSLDYTPAVGVCCALFSPSNDMKIRMTPATSQVFFNTDMFSALSLSPSAVLWPTKLVSSYTGPAFSLTKADGSDKTDFSYTLGGASNGIGSTVDPSLVSEFSTGTILVEKWYDQSGNGSHMGPYQGEVSQWYNPTTAKPPSTYNDYPRYMLARDVNYYVPHFGANFLDYDVANMRYNRMDMSLPIDGEMYYTFFFAVGPTVKIGDDDYYFCYNYVENNFILGPNSSMKIEGYENVSTNATISLNKLNIYSVEYNGGSLSSTETGNTVTQDGVTLTFTGGTSKVNISLNASTGAIAVTPNGSGSSTNFVAKHYNISSGNFSGGLRFIWSDNTNLYVLNTEYYGNANYSIYNLDGYYTICKNGDQVYTSSASGPIVDTYNGIMNVCWNRFYESSTVADVIGFIGIPSKITNSQRDIIYNNLYSSLQTTNP